MSPKAEAPDYYEVIHFPIKLKTMTKHLRSRYYRTQKLFVADLQWVIANCREYNTLDTEHSLCPWHPSFFCYNQAPSLSFEGLEWVELLHRGTT
uniref:Bromo domain-containing protein n=1 Tax=Sarcophilus harrisii TaxID=9305 RepID=A0A7N4NKV6_SARHA